MRSIAVAAAVTALLVVAMPISAFAAKSPGPPQLDHVFLRTLTYGGDGCPNGTAAQAISNDRESFTIIFDSYIASVGPNAPIQDSRSACQLNINLQVPQGARNTVLKLQYHGSLQLPQDATAHRSANYYLEGSILKTTSVDFTGLSQGDWLAEDVIPLHLNSLDLTPCGQVLPVNVGASIEVAAPNGQAAQMVIDSIDGSIQQTGEGVAC